MTQKRTGNLNRQSPGIKSLRNSAAELGDSARDQFAYAMKALGGHSSKIRSYVKKNPEKALMIAIGLGVTIGALGSTFFGKNNNK